MDTVANPPSKSEAAKNLAMRLLGEMPIYLIGVAIMALCIGILLAQGVSPSVSGVIENARIFGLFVLILVAFDAAWQLNRNRPKSPTSFLKERYTAKPLWHVISSGLPLMAIAIVVLPFFSKMKSAIPLFNEYTWDQTFIEWDRAIFFGYDAWEVMQPVLGFPIVTAFLAFLYHIWFLLLYPGVMFFAFYRMDSQLRRQFFLTYMLSWSLIGGAMATWLASVGPVFLEPMLGNAHFAPQMDYLNAANEQIPIMTLRVQGLLLEWHGASSSGLGSGITAMPSMHCAIAFIYWLAVRQIHKGWGMFFGAFFIITWISSVHLAYHYAVDGLVSMIAVVAIWWAAKFIIAAWDGFLARRSETQATLRTNTVPAE
ncbi:phosphatase PAP2 family protein [Erythrobacter crassostreae]|uniref:Phosphatase PAP2 family protein n=1 Tax=Erythrobacter crassostreae TaxID=2828328 RepID=A0A9X1F4G4_9SPHN|nr:phosphatase PAP2 family protein [Erythrobacter crassostrea]MBV7259654.1 phosphatase PAP2 family protein [Erythrobacter crassostrea]